MSIKENSEAIFSESPGKIALRNLRKDKRSIISLTILGFIVAISLLAPIYSHFIAHTNPFNSSLDATIYVGGKTVPVLEASTTGLGLGVTPIGPTWNPSSYFLGADGQGRDVMARLLYGGRNTLLIGTSAGIICIVFSLLIGVIAGYRKGWVDAILSRLLDVIWAFPVYLLAISLSVVLLTSGLTIGFIHLGPGSFALPILIIGIVYIPYVARPIRAQVLSLREREFVDAAKVAGASNRRIIFKHILPNAVGVIIVSVTLIMSGAILLETALSYLGFGVVAPDVSLGLLISQYQDSFSSRPWLFWYPGIFIILIALTVNFIGDGLRDAFDPRQRRRILRKERAAERKVANA